MRFISTRGSSPALGFNDACATGLAADGGLYVPAELPDIAGVLRGGEEKSYPQLAHEFFSLFDQDHPPSQLKALIDDAYSRFDDPGCAPLRKLRDGLWVLELFHGPTLAFKDFGLQLLGNLFEDQIARTGQPINVLGATSGDTGAAAISGLAGKEGVNVFILYPHGRISPLQERQMTCTGADNIFPIPIEGSFDDAQAIIKEIFSDLDFKAEHSLSAINSINLARVLAQSVYYIHAWLQLPEEAREAGPEFIVPTGNFGNVLAGWMVSKMGLPIPSFQIATNQNDLLHRLFATGQYAPGEVAPSLAPSMDIQLASNFERFLHFASDGDGPAVAQQMETLKSEGALDLAGFDPDTFRASRSDDADIREAIARVHAEFDYVVDPHTACGFKDIPADRPAVVLSTAHPAKFPEAIEDAIGHAVTHPRLEALKSRTPATYPAPPTAEAIRELLDRHAV